jgi:hypothetical protein
MKQILPRTVIGIVCSIAVACTIAATSAHATNDSLLYHDGAKFVHQWNKSITDILVDDSQTPCRISRIYAYHNIAAYEAALPGFPMCRSLEDQLTGLKDLPKPDPKLAFDWRVSTIAAYRAVAEKLLFRYYRADSLYQAQMQELRASGVPADVIERSRAYGDSVGKRVLAWANVDGYNKIVASASYVIPKGRGMWEPTPPDFADPVDPFWNTIRPFSMTSPGQFKPVPPLPFSTDPKSDFYKQALDVYNVNKNLTEEQEMVAKFWDCNPIHSRHFGHVMFATRQISPGGHWINITKIACTQKDLGMMETLEAYTMVSVGLADGFISAWTEKYAMNGIRPVTYINRYIDSTWTPLIQTPPFPEYASAHSTISAVAGTILTHIFGEIPFDDDTEVYLGLPVRRFNNFMDAAREAAMSRLYGGIHYRRSNLVGSDSGVELGNYIWGKIHTRV